MFAIASLAVLALALGVRADLVIDTPDSITQCSPVTFQISGSTPGPYYAFVVNSGDPCGNALAEIDNISGNSFTWTPTVPAGTSIAIAIESEDGSTEGWSGAVTIGAGDSGCLTGSSSAPASSSTPATTTTHSTAHAVTYSAPENVASDAAATTSTSGASRAVVGASSVLALVGAAVAALSL